MKAFVSVAATVLLLLASRATPSLAAQPRPNILFAIADDASWPHMSAYGCKFVSTPAFDRVAKEGVLFNNAFTPTPKCSPSRAILLTGKNPWQLEDAANHFGLFPAKFDVFPDLLEKGGYFVGFTGKGWGPGEWKAAGRTRNPAGTAFNQKKARPPREGISPNDYAANFEAFLLQRPKDKPFCFWYGGTEPHRSYAPGSGAAAGKKLADITVPPYLPDNDIVRSDLADYALEIEHFDAHLGRMLAALEAAGELDNTLVVVTADNGMPFPRVKGHIYEDACHLPLAIRWGAKVKPGRTVDDLVSFADIAPTFSDAAGITPVQPMTGKSLMNVLVAEGSGRIDPARDHVLLGRERCDVGRPNDEGFPVRAIRTKDLFYARNFAPDRWPAGNPETGYTDIDDSPTKRLIIDRGATRGPDRFTDLALAKRGAEELYDLKADPSCVTNLAGDPKFAQAKQKLWSQLESELKAQQDPRVLGQGDVFDRYKSYAGRNRSWDTVEQGRKPTTAPAPKGD